GALQPDRVFLVPILPRWHASLFPVADDSDQLTLYEGMSNQGNAIRKAYVCHSGSKNLEAVTRCYSCALASLRWSMWSRGTRLVVQSLCGLGLVGRGPL